MAINGKERIEIMSGAKRKNNKNKINGPAPQKTEALAGNAGNSQEAVGETVAETVDKTGTETVAASEIEEIQEFVVSSAKARSERKKAEQASISAIATWSKEKKSIAVLALFVVIALAYVLVGILACKVNPVVVCVVLLIQVAIGVLLDQNPVWLHACVAAASVVAGICVGQTLLMVAAVIVYIAAIVALEMLQRMGMLGRA